MALMCGQDMLQLINGRITPALLRQHVLNEPLIHLLVKPYHWFRCILEFCKKYAARQQCVSRV